ncbi:MAG: DUF6916 family protein [Ignavibacteria bacterium]
MADFSDLISLTHQDFLPLLGERFDLALADGVMPLRLVEVTPPARIPGGRDQFSLIFKSGEQRAVPQGTYALDHAHAGGLALFIVPVARDADGVSYQAVFA